MTTEKKDLSNLVSDIEQLNKQTKILNPISIDLEINENNQKIIDIESKLNTLKSKLETLILSKSNEKVIAVIKTKVSDLETNLRQLNQSIDYKNSILRDLKEIETKLSQIEDIDINYAYCIKLIGIYESYRAMWELEKGLLKHQKSKLRLELEKLNIKSP